MLERWRENVKKRIGERKMTKKEFKKRWESDEHGGGITLDDVADCYKEWGLGSQPRCKPIPEVLKAAGVKDI